MVFSRWTEKMKKLRIVTLALPTFHDTNQRWAVKVTIFYFWGIILFWWIIPRKYYMRSLMCAFFALLVVKYFIGKVPSFLFLEIPFESINIWWKLSKCKERERCLESLDKTLVLWKEQVALYCLCIDTLATMNVNICLSGLNLNIYLSLMIPKFWINIITSEEFRSKPGHLNIIQSKVKIQLPLHSLAMRGNRSY
jgi:hypothetical protein